MRLTETLLKSMRDPDEKPLVITDDSTEGLYFKLNPRKRNGDALRVWQYRTRKGGVERAITLGRWPGMSLTAARQKALELGKGAPPDALTFGKLALQWFERRIEHEYKRTDNVEVYVRYAARPPLGNMQCARLTTSVLVDALLEYAKRAPVSANRCLTNWKLALDYGVEIGALAYNPLARTTSRSVGGKEKSRDRTLTDNEIRWVWSPKSGASSARCRTRTRLRSRCPRCGCCCGGFNEPPRPTLPTQPMRPLLSDEQIETLAQELSTLDPKVAWARLTKMVTTIDRGPVWARRMMICIEAKRVQKQQEAEQRKQQEVERRRRVAARRKASV